MPVGQLGEPWWMAVMGRPTTSRGMEGMAARRKQFILLAKLTISGSRTNRSRPQRSRSRLATATSRSVYFLHVFPLACLAVHVLFAKRGASQKSRTHMYRMLDDIHRVSEDHEVLGKLSQAVASMLPWLTKRFLTNVKRSQTQLQAPHIVVQSLPLGQLNLGMLRSGWWNLQLPANFHTPVSM